ncbi:hypothetical protein SCHPADRAFT_1000672 [Schizopora paradoxa]|uniref:Uncharacterized protein n=1 Tax=Schizopora paradoxa TaxID=27342 RepID=A0A0H2RH52_9AGAM|nr:hypothetical protein SCHPADRAFT_1000672 [Schizopora paradoxa]
MSYANHLPLARIDSMASVSTNATAPNLPGPGRNLGLLLDRVGKRVESFLNKCASRSGMGPIATAQKIRQLRRYSELTLREHYSLSPMRLTKSDAKKLIKYCDKLLGFLKSNVLSTQLNALEEFTALSIEDSLIRAIFIKCQLEYYFEQEYDVLDLHLASAKAFGSIVEAKTHKLWSSIALKPDFGLYYVPDRESIKNSLSDPDTSFIAARHLLNVIGSASPSVGYTLLRETLRFKVFIIDIWLKSQHAVDIILRGLSSENTPYRRSLARAFALEIASWNRYCKLMIHNHGSFNCKPFPFSINLYRKISRCTTTLLRPFLLRIIVDGSCRFIIRDQAYRCHGQGTYTAYTARWDYKIIARIIQTHPNKNISVDILHHPNEEILKIEIGEVDSFNAAGHYPILAGYDQSTCALYCAECNFYPRIITCVNDGSSNAVFVDEHGEIQTTRKFTVLVLRFDPSDIIAHHTNDFEGAMDPTGPLHWRRLWPAEDPSLQSMMHKRDYNYLKIYLVPFLDRCAQDAKRESILRSDFENVAPEKQEPNDTEASSIENFQCLGALPFAKNRTARTVGKEEMSNDELHGKAMNEECGNKLYCGEKDIYGNVLLQCAIESAEGIMEALSESLELRQGWNNGDYTSSRVTQVNEANEDRAISAVPVPDADVSEAKGNEEDFDSLKTKNRLLEEKIARLEAELRDLRQ